MGHVETLSKAEAWVKRWREPVVLLVDHTAVDGHGESDHAYFPVATPYPARYTAHSIMRHEPTAPRGVIIETLPT